MAQMAKNLPPVQETWVPSLVGRSLGEEYGNPLQCSCLEDPMDRGAWWAAVHGVTKSWTQLAAFGEGNGTPLQYSCLENPMDRGAWWAAVHGVVKSWT